MLLHILEQLSEPGNRVNEDIAGSTETAAWVMDGATGLGDERLLPGESDAAWLVRRVDRFLRSHADDATTGIRELLAGAMEDVRAEYERSRLRDAVARYELPSAGIILVRRVARSIEYARLGDCTGVFMVDGVTSSSRSSRLRDLDEQVVETMRGLQRAGLRDLASVRRATADDLRANRNLANTKGGYWVLGIEPEAANHAKTEAVPLEHATSGLLMSDGFYRAVDTFRLVTEDRSPI